MKPGCERKPSLSWMQEYEVYSLFLSHPFGLGLLLIWLQLKESSYNFDVVGRIVSR